MKAIVQLWYLLLLLGLAATTLTMSPSSDDFFAMLVVTGIIDYAVRKVW